MALREDKKMKFGDIIYYSDPLHDDFEKTTLKRPPLPENYIYIKKGILSRFFDFLVFFCICKPILGLIMRFSGFKYKNRWKVRKLVKNGCFLYSNHTSFFDAFGPQVSFPRKRTYVTGYTDALTLPWIIRFITRHAGYLPLPNDIKDYKKFDEALKHITNNTKSNILIFPEAHIWPFYTKIRDFSAASFTYPAKYNKPVVPIVTCYRKSKFSNRAKSTIIYLDPIFPKPELNEKENKNYLHDECLKAMKKCAMENSKYEYVHYIYKEKTNDEAQN